MVVVPFFFFLSFFFRSIHYRLPQTNYFHRIPRIPPYQTTPFTIDPSARSTQTFAERYGVSPPHSPDDLYSNEYSVDGKNGKRNQKTSKVSKEHQRHAQTAVIKESVGVCSENEQNSKNFLPNSFDVELLQVSFSTFLIKKELHRYFLFIDS